MAFWSEANLDPKRKFRWVVQIAGLGIGEYIAKTVDKPKFEVSEEEHKFINHTFYYPGRVTWQEVSLTLDAEGAPIESWVLHNAWLKSVEFGELTYEDEGLVEVSMTVRYDWATVE